VYRQVEGKTDFAFDDMGEQKVKNIERPIRAYRVRLDGEDEGTGSTATKHTSALELPDKPSIAVLPFDNMSGDPEQEFFADGLAEDILTMLSKVSALFVIARNSTFAYKGQVPDVRRVGEELGVRYVLEGSVRKGGERLRITAQLIDTADGSHVWAESYNRTIADIFDLQDDITKEIVTALRVQLTDGEAAQVWSRGTDNIEAWKCMVRAVELWQRFGARDIAEALSLSKKAASLDPDYALAWAMRGMVCWAGARTGGGDEPLAEAEEYAAKALALDDTDSWTLGLNSVVLLSRGRQDEAVAMIRRAVERNPGNADVWAFLGFCLLPAGQPEEALRAFDDAIRLNPLYPIWYLPAMARARDAAGKPGKAIELAEQILARDADYFPALLHLASLYARAGRDEDAREAAASVLRLTPGFKVGFTAKWLMTRDEAFAATFAEGLTKAGLPA
jgi:adenylate cyclase